MLILTRRAGQEIVIHDEVHVQVLSINGRRVHIGVTAPRTVRVERGEVRRQRVGNQSNGDAYVGDPSCADALTRVTMDAKPSHCTTS